MIKKIFPFVRWFSNYTSAHFRVDLISGLTVALVLIPQSMAYAQLADLPAYYGLYAAFLPPIIASLFGSSNQLATGPVAVVSLMTATALAPLATAGSEAYIAYAIVLSLIVGLFQFMLGVFRLGLVVNFLSHPVVNGFTNAAALIIATSQLSKLFGVTAEKAEHHYQTVYNVIKAAMHSTHLPTLGLAVLAFAIMYVLRKINRNIPNVLVAVLVTTIISWATGYEHNIEIKIDSFMDQVVTKEIESYNSLTTNIEDLLQKRVELSNQLSNELKKAGKHSIPELDLEHEVGILNLNMEQFSLKKAHLRRSLQDYKFSITESNPPKAYLKDLLPEGVKVDKRTWHLKVGNGRLKPDALTIIGGGSVVGSIPRGLPGISVPEFNLRIFLQLFSMAIVISLLGFMEAISIAKAMAVRTGQRLDPNQELIGQGLANIAGSFVSSYPVSGSFSRSAVNIQAGAVTGISNVISSGVVLVILLFFTPLLYHLPQAALAAIIMMAVIGLLNVQGFIHAWQAQRYDGVIAIITFVTTLAFAPHLDKGIMIGLVLSLGHFLLRNTKPDIALLSKYYDGTYRNAERRNMRQCRHIAVVRFSSSLFFANVSYLEDQILDLENRMPDLKHVHIVGNGINELDASGEEVLSTLIGRLRKAGYDVSFSGLNDHVLDVMHRTHLFEKIGENHIFGNVTQALLSFFDKTHTQTEEDRCPLVDVIGIGLPVAPEIIAKMKAMDKKATEWSSGSSSK